MSADFSQLKKQYQLLLAKSQKEEWKNKELLNVIIPLGVALSAEKNLNNLLHKILTGAKSITNADGGTIYIRDKNELIFKIILNESLDISWEDNKDSLGNFPPIRLYDELSGEYNCNNVASLVAIEGRTVNIPDAYENDQFDFSGTKVFDEKNHYRSTSFLTIPLKNHASDVIGVLQLINARNDEKTEIISFSDETQLIIESLASLAAMALDNQTLLQAQKNLLDSFIKLISDAIDQKSPYTGGHCKRIPLISELLVRAACAEKEGPFADFDLTEEGLYELQTAAWLHDIGKITTPEYVVDKATKLETIYDRINTVKTRMEVLKRDAEIDHLKRQISQPEQKESSELQYLKKIKQYEDDIKFLENANLGGEFMRDEDKARVKEIASYTWTDFEGKNSPFLSENEVYNLCIERGTLTEEERKIINHHIVATINMLEKLPFPKHLNRVVEYAGGHHEKMDGSGYPKGLTREQMSIPARIMAIADIYEALTASDRPYKKGKKLSEAIRIMSFMEKDNHIDSELFQLFLKSNVYKIYAKQILKPEQIDEFDIGQYIKS